MSRHNAHLAEPGETEYFLPSAATSAKLPDTIEIPERIQDLIKPFTEPIEQLQAELTRLQDVAARILSAWSPMFADGRYALEGDKLVLIKEDE